MIIILFSWISLASAFDWNQTTCPAVSGETKSLVDLQRLSFEALKKIQIDAAKKDVGSFCRKNLISRYLNVNNVPIDKRLSTTGSNLEQIANKVPNNEPTLWGNTLISTRQSRSNAFATILETKKNKEYSVIIPPSNPEMGEPLTKVSAEMSIVEMAACAREGIFKALQCKKALDELKVLSVPRDGANRLMTPDAWKSIYSSNSYDRGIHEASALIQDFVKQPAKMKKDSNVFSLLRESFIKSGLSFDSADEAAWNVLAAIANAGPNIVNRAMSFGYGQKTIDLSIIANGMGMLDYEKGEKGYSLFSYPEQVNAHCDSAKPYHFWMSAYIARKLVQDQKISKADAVKYVMLADKGYQVNRGLVSGTVETNTGARILERDDFDPAQQVVRMDIAYSAAGSAFGADSAKSISNGNFYDVDKAIVNLQMNAGPSSRAKTQDLGALKRLENFESVFKPDAAIDSILGK